MFICGSTATVYCTLLYVCVCRMKKRSGAGFRQTSRQQWWWPMTSRWRLSRSCVHSGGSCRRSRIAARSFPQTSRPCRESGTISTILHPPPKKNPHPSSLCSPRLASGCSSFLSQHIVEMRYLPESCHILHVVYMRCKQWCIIISTPTNLLLKRFLKFLSGIKTGKV